MGVWPQVVAELERTPSSAEFKYLLVIGACENLEPVQTVSKRRTLTLLATRADIGRTEPEHRQTVEVVEFDLVRYGVAESCAIGIWNRKTAAAWWVAGQLTNREG